MVAGEYLTQLVVLLISRALMKHGEEWPKKYDLSTLRVIGSVGEPINPEAWRWYFHNVGRGQCSVVDTYWQTETGGHVLAPFPGATITKPGCAMVPFFGIEPVIVDPQTGEEKKGNEVFGVLCLKRPWPGNCSCDGAGSPFGSNFQLRQSFANDSLRARVRDAGRTGMCRSVHRAHKRLVNTYLQPYPGYYFTGDGAYRDVDGHYWITGRVDDTLNVSGSIRHLCTTAPLGSDRSREIRTMLRSFSYRVKRPQYGEWIQSQSPRVSIRIGHRLSTAELEHALVQHPGIVEAAVVGVPHDVKGTAIFCFVILKVIPAGLVTSYRRRNLYLSKRIVYTLVTKFSRCRGPRPCMQEGVNPDGLTDQAKIQVRKEIGPIATPDFIVIAPGTTPVLRRHKHTTGKTPAGFHSRYDRT